MGVFQRVRKVIHGKRYLRCVLFDELRHFVGMLDRHRLINFKKDELTKGNTMATQLTLV